MMVPLCKTCKYYIPSQHGSFNDSSLAKCKKIGTMDIVNGENEYSLAQSVREFSCGQEGVWYSPEPRVRVKKMAYTLRKRWYVFGHLLYAIIKLFLILQKK